MSSEELRKRAEEKLRAMLDQIGDSSEKIEKLLKNMAFLKAKKEISGLTEEEEKDVKYLEIGISSEVIASSYEAGSSGRDFLIKFIKMLVREALS